MSSPAGSAGSGAGTFTTIASPALTRWLGSRIVRPPIATAPSRISALSRVRDSAGMSGEHAVEPAAGLLARDGDFLLRAGRFAKR